MTAATHCWSMLVPKLSWTWEGLCWKLVCTFTRWTMLVSTVADRLFVLLPMMCGINYYLSIILQSWRIQSFDFWLNQAFFCPGHYWLSRPDNLYTGVVIVWWEPWIAGKSQCESLNLKERVELSDESWCTEVQRRIKEDCHEGCVQISAYFQSHH